MGVWWWAVLAGSAHGAEVFVLRDDDAAGVTAVEQLLVDAGHTVTLSPQTDDVWEGDGLDPEVIEVVLHLHKATQGSDVPSAGQAALVDAAALGVGYVSTEYVSQDFDRGRLVQLGELVLLDYLSSVLTSSVDLTEEGLVHPVTAALPPTFALDYFAVRAYGRGLDDDIRLASGTSGASVVRVRTPPDAGRVVAFAAPVQFSDASTVAQPEVATLIAAAVGWAARCSDPDGDGDLSARWCGGTDCDDADPDISGFGVEVCDGVDQDCDGVIDEGTGGSSYADEDGDGYADPAAWMESCAGLPEELATDCDDTDPDVHPGVVEPCTGIDADCDGEVDAGAEVALTWFPDADGDGYGDSAGAYDACAPDPPTDAPEGGDCDDLNPEAWPGQDERCNGFDDDCDGSTDESGAVDAATVYRDNDGDGYGAGGAVVTCFTTGYVDNRDDCNDADSSMHPGAEERCNGNDDDCDFVIDEDAVDEVDVFVDGDGDGFGDPELPRVACAEAPGVAVDGGDCDDRDAGVYPGAAEVCDGVDTDCDGDLDELAADAFPVWVDGDGDGVGAGGWVLACLVPAGRTDVDGDCDDADAGVFPGAIEVCDGVDQDCDGRVDDGAVDQLAGWPDQDGDGFGADGAPTVGCALPDGFVARPGDCDDRDPDAHPGAPETCAPGDQDCDGVIDEDPADGLTWFVDLDGDGHGDPTAEVVACAAPDGGVADGDDCDDRDAAVFPGAEGWSPTCEPLPDDPSREAAARGCASAPVAPAGLMAWAALLLVRRRVRRGRASG